MWIENLLLKTTGQGFEDLFTSLAKQHWREDFEPWKPQGSLGDFKCDGYQVSTKTVYQCHGPEQPVPSTTTSKIERDFEGAKGHFGERMRKWVFIYNQRELPATSGKLIGDLRERNPDIEINAWVREDVLNFAVDLNPDSLAVMFPGLQGDHEVSGTMLAAMNNFVAERNAQENLAVRETGQEPTNAVTLGQALDALAEQDRTARLRILGYCKWLDPLPIERAMALLKEKGHPKNVVSSSIERLSNDGLVKVTGLHILPQNDRVCAEAADLVAEEFLEALSGV